MKNFFLNKIRLTYYLFILFAIFVTVVMFIPDVQFTSGALTLFSVNSFLYGFYISPILSGQKARIEELHKIARSEANALFSMALVVAKCPVGFRTKIQDMLLDYTDHVSRHRRPAGGEEKYEAMISYCIKYEGQHESEVAVLLDKLVANQQNRTNYAMQLRNTVYKNEWMVTMILFSVTLTFVLLLDTGELLIYKILAALLCSGLSMLILILVKLSTLNHKKALQIWDPYKKLMDSKFYRID